MLPAEQAFPVGEQDAVSAAVVEPMSIAVRAVARGRVASGREGGRLRRGPDRHGGRRRGARPGASVLLVDPHRVASRARTRRRSRRAPSSRARIRSPAALEWAGGDGPEVVFEATGVRLDRTDGRGARRPGGPRGDRRARHRGDAPLETGTSPSRRSTCSGRARAAPTTSPRRSRSSPAGATRWRASSRTSSRSRKRPRRSSYAMRHPADVMKAVIRLDGQ